MAQNFLRCDRYGRPSAMASEISASLAPVETTRQFHIFGREIPHSISPAMHNAGFQYHNLDCSYRITETESVEDCPTSIARADFGGASVAMPYKLEVMRYCGIVTAEAKLMGAVNTLCVRTDAHGQRLIEGDNTDWIGVLNCIQAKYPTRGKESPKMGWVIGAGGAARAAVYALHAAGTERIFISNRSHSKAESLVSAFSDHFKVEIIDDWSEMNEHPADVVIGTVPANAVYDSDFYGIEWNSAGGLCIDLSYNPRVTPLLWVVADVPKWKIVNGLQVLLEQGYAQYRKWTALEPPKELIMEAIGCDLLQDESDPAADHCLATGRKPIVQSCKL